jgi:DNA-binding CsgD family transcriptional regulator
MWPAPSRLLLAETIAWGRDIAKQADHPLASWFVRTGEMRAQSMGHLPAAAVDSRLLESWREVAAPHGIEHQLSIPVYLQGTEYRTFVLSRPDENFSDTDLALARLLQSMLVGLDRQATALAGCAHLGLPQALSVAAASAELSGRELAVLSLLPGGLTATAIARRLNISPRTVHKHLENIYRKMRTSDRVTTVLRAQQLGLLPTATPTGDSREGVPG